MNEIAEVAIGVGFRDAVPLSQIPEDHDAGCDGRGPAQASAFVAVALLLLVDGAVLLRARVHGDVHGVVAVAGLDIAG